MENRRKGKDVRHNKLRKWNSTDFGGGGGRVKGVNGTHIF